jgi:hypothetical protein
MPAWLTQMLVITVLVGIVTGCASPSSDRPAAKEPSEEKGKRSEPFRY